MSKEETLSQLAEAVHAFDKEAVKKAAEEAIAEGIEPLEALNTVTGAAREVGDMFSNGEIFLAELIMAGEAMRSAIDTLRPALGTQMEAARLGKVVIATVAGDIHDLGKNIVATMLAANGFEVKDLGVDCAPDKILDEAEGLGADIIAMSCLLTSSTPSMEETIRLLEEEGVRDKYKVMIGGPVLSDEVAKDMGADCYGRDAAEAVNLARQLVGR